jgi:hypothetical protein
MSFRISKFHSKITKQGEKTQLNKICLNPRSHSAEQRYNNTKCTDVSQELKQKIRWSLPYHFRDISMIIAVLHQRYSHGNNSNSAREMLNNLIK